MTTRIILVLLALILVAPVAHGASISVTQDPAPTCKVRASKTRMTSGTATTITWKSKHADSMTGFLRGKVMEPNGKERLGIAFTGKQTFNFVFTGSGGTKTCSINIFVHPKKKK